MTHPIELPIEAQIAITILRRNERMTGIEPELLLLQMLKKAGFHSDNIKQLENKGLTIHFKKLAQLIKNNSLYLQLFLYCININKSTFITNYTTQNNTIIKLSDNSICTELYNNKKYLTHNVIKRLCKKIPLYNLYKNT